MHYFHPLVAIQNFGLGLDEDILRTLQNGVSDYGCSFPSTLPCEAFSNRIIAQDEYLPPETLAWCTDHLHQLGFNPYHPPELSEKEARERPHQETIHSFERG